jgi:hypothetical protein
MRSLQTVRVGFGGWTMVALLTVAGAAQLLVLSASARANQQNKDSSGSLATVPPLGEVSQTWLAASKTAMSITGNITFASNKMTIREKVFPLKLVREIDSQHLEDVGKIVDRPQPPSSARLYKTAISKHASLVNGNTICGPGADARWVLVVSGSRELSLAFFSGDSEPNLDIQSVESDNNLCGTYAYVSRLRSN